jgi:hypothetical protein
MRHVVQAHGVRCIEYQTQSFFLTDDFLARAARDKPGPIPRQTG